MCLVRCDDEMVTVVQLSSSRSSLGASLLMENLDFYFGPELSLDYKSRSSFSIVALATEGWSLDCEMKGAERA